MPTSRVRRAATIVAVTGVVVVLALAVSADRGSRSGVADAGTRLAIVDGSGRLTVTDRAGSILRRFPADGPAVRFPAFSPDGRRIAAIGALGTTSGVYVYDLGDGPGATPVPAFESTETGLIYLSWSPDGGRLGVLTSEPSTLALRVLAPDGAVQDTVVHEGQPLYWDWWAGRGLFIHTGGTGPGAVVDEIDADGTTLDLGLGPSGLFQAPGISSGGRFRAYAAIESAGRQVLRIEERDGPGANDIEVGAAVAFGWSPTIDAVAFVDGGGAAGTGLGPLRIVDAAEGSPRTVLDRPVAAWFWSPDGRFLAAFALQLRADDSIASTAHQATPPLELHLVIVEADGGAVRSDRVIKPGDLFLRQFVPFFDQYAKSHRVWAPDSSAVVLPLVGDDGVERITVIPVDEGPVVDVGPGVLAFWSP